MINLQLELPEGFLNGEERDGYYVDKEKKEIWAVELDLLNEFMRVCKKYGLKYFAAAGTVLGAVRHRGFIPWDDDIDVMMLRDEYDKLCKVAEKEFTFPYFFQTEYTDPGALRGHAQLRNSLTTGILKKDEDENFTFNQGIFLDIFVLDKIPDDERLFNKQIKRASRYKRAALLLGNCTYRYNEKRICGFRGFCKKSIHVIWKKFFASKKRVNRYYIMFEKEITKYNSSETKRVTNFFQFPLNKKRRVWNIEDVLETVDMPFEMFQLPLPKGYEVILDQFYGDWKTYQIGTSTHGETIFDTNRSYKEYLAERKEI